MSLVIDTFTFFNELELLELRLNILDPYVDMFVLVEATRTFQNQPKPLYFFENKDRFKPFLQKIHHIVVDDFPEYHEATSAWRFEYHQRNAIMRGLEHAAPEDFVMVSDLDEIPNPEAILLAQEMGPGIKAFKQRLYYYFLNCQNVSDDWLLGTKFCRKKELTSPQAMRRPFGQVIENGGWHWSYLGGVDRIIQKLGAYAHTEYNQDYYKNPQRILEFIQQGKDIFDRDYRYQFVNIDASYPQYLRDNLEKYSHLIK